MGLGAVVHGQTVANGDFSSPTNTAGGTDTNVTAWTLSPAPNTDGGVLNYTNVGQRCTFGGNSPAPSTSDWSFWEQTFCQYGTATQTVGVTAGLTYTLSDQQQFQIPGFNNITAANQSAGTPNNGENGGNGYSYLGLLWLNNHGVAIGTPNADGLSIEDIIPAGSVSSSSYIPESIGGVAPVGATSAEVVLGWANGGMDGANGGQSVFATDVALSVPEPASMSLLAIGAGALFIRRRSKTAVK